MPPAVAAGVCGRLARAPHRRGGSVISRASGATIPSIDEFPAQAGVIRELPMGKRGRKKRSRKGNAANHGKRPNA
ncbi:hypothetical protein FMUAM8_44840 [Nocardia cyriacigeorgica]|nr:hypothetical protein FMUAM8_44840 [Nocardia cyriacigeorgica]